jgi:hypothetical protein
MNTIRRAQALPLGAEKRAQTRRKKGEKSPAAPCPPLNTRAKKQQQQQK